MSITDELRHEVANYPFRDNRDFALFEAIADRIDTEHEKACAESWMRGHDVWASVGNEGKMAELGWMRLPKDADGELVHLGDVMEVKSMTFRVASIEYGQHPDIGDGMFWMLWNADGSVFERADQCRHRTSTVEDVLSEMLDAVDDDRYGQDRIIAEYAAKLRLAGDTE